MDILTCGRYHACASTTDGELQCWGANSNYQVGIGSTGNQFSPQTVNVGDGVTVTVMAAGEQATCAGLSDDSLKCWGKNGNGQLGIGSTSAKSTPYTTTTGDKVLYLAGGTSHFCATFETAGTKCWGYNWWGVIGNGASNQNAVTTPTSTTISDVIALGQTSPAYHACAAKEDEIKCWGKGSSGALGYGQTSSKNLPTSVIW